MEGLVLSYVWKYLLIKTATDDLKGKVLSQACQRKPGGQKQQKICLNIYVLVFQVVKYFISFSTKCSFRREEGKSHQV